MAAEAALAATWLGALLRWAMGVLLLVRPVGTEAVSTDGGGTITHAVYWRPAPGWAGAGFVALAAAAALAPSAVVWLAARGRRWAVAGIGSGVLVLSCVAFLLTPRARGRDPRLPLPPMPAGLCWPLAGIWPGAGVRRRARGPA